MLRCTLCGILFNADNSAIIINPNVFTDTGMLSGSRLTCCKQCGMKVGPLSAGRLDYERSLREKPHYPAMWGLDAEARPSWDKLEPIAKRSWIMPYSADFDAVQRMATDPHYLLSVALQAV